jgi:metallothionein
MKCACSHQCVCEVGSGEALERNGQMFCSETCASGHLNGQGCGHSGCNCQ